MNEIESPAGIGEVIAPESTTPDAATPIPAAAAAPAGEQLYEVKVDGKTIRVPLSELTGGYSRTKDYTAKTMALAEERRKWAETEKGYVTEKTQLKEFLKDPQNVQRLYNYLVKQQGYADPDQPLNAGQVEQLATSRSEAIVNQKMAEMQQTMRQQQLETTYVGEVDTHIKGLLGTHPELKTLRGIETLLKQQTAAQNPDSIDEAKAMMAQIASEQATALKTYWTEQQKVNAITAGAVAPANGIEPPGGAAPMPGAKPEFKLNDPALKADAIAYLNEKMSKS